MSQFTDPQLGYALFDTVVIRLSAQNVKGQSEYNQVTFQSTVATVKTVPASMPSDSISRGSQTTEDLLHILWQPVTSQTLQGDSAILSYNL